MRLFVGIDIPPGIKDELRGLVGRLKPLAQINWSPIDNMHLTTKFIGEWPERRLPEMKAALTTVGAVAPVDIEIAGLGWFPNASNPRVFWAGVDGGEELRALAASTENAAAALGVAKEDRVYSPHLTLARIKDHIALSPLREAVSREEASLGNFSATAFHLYLSAGGKYTKLADYPIG